MIIKYKGFKNMISIRIAKKYKNLKRNHLYYIPDHESDIIDNLSYSNDIEKYSNKEYIDHLNDIKQIYNIDEIPTEDLKNKPSFNFYLPNSLPELLFALPIVDSWQKFHPTAVIRLIIQDRFIPFVKYFSLEIYSLNDINNSVIPDADETFDLRKESNKHLFTPLYQAVSHPTDLFAGILLLKLINRKPDLRYSKKKQFQ